MKAKLYRQNANGEMVRVHLKEPIIVPREFLESYVGEDGRTHYDYGGRILLKIDTDGEITKIK